LPDLDGVSDDVSDHIGMGTTLDVAKEQASKISVHTLIMADEFI